MRLAAYLAVTLGAGIAHAHGQTQLAMVVWLTGLAFYLTGDPPDPQHPMEVL